MRCEFTARAEADLESIGDYIAKDNPLRAVTFIQEVRKRCYDVAKIRWWRPEYSEGIQRVPLGRFLIFYTSSEIKPLPRHSEHSI